VTPLTSSDDAFRYFRDRRGVDTDGDTDAIALFAFALVEQDRIDWVEHFRTDHDAGPTTEQVVEWYRGKPESYFRDKERTAEVWYASFARWYLRDEISAEQQKAIHAVVGDLGKFWPTFWNGNLTGITSNIFFAILVVAFVYIITTDFSFIAWTKGLLGSAPMAPKSP
jgi:hypothetical protein